MVTVRPQGARTIDEILASARARLVRVTPRQAFGELAGGGVLIDIRNPLANGQAVPAVGGSGTGLIGLTERVRLAGGELDQQLTPAGEFRLSARLPWPA